MQKYDFTETDRKYSYHGFLGAEYSPIGTEFSVWSPYAESITLRLYESCTADSPVKQIAMKMDADGVWRCTATGDLDGIYYAYLVAHSGKECETPDIYARSAGINGKRGMIFSPQSVDIKGWDIDRPVKLRSPADAVIYELHIRDLSMDENADFKHRGKFTAMCEEGVKNSHGDSVGLDYISQLGVTHVHLLPVMDYQSVDEKDIRMQNEMGETVHDGTPTEHLHDQIENKGEDRRCQNRPFCRSLFKFGIECICGRDQTVQWMLFLCDGVVVASRIHMCFPCCTIMANRV